ncbi:hypothetical protein BN940_00076 [Castellaniella defragrans 65Phen]|uniref:Uncharacterized protein n=1 Tax=Castellaniella defragrans (strain DSM 12143 / CCUG 39792 / 65Phen) TaxID=1437824 RepID=W8X0P5_CASD6|nr:hypothetical protein BN940_00076 [Castellaniella defragrans 65Phen]
MAAHIPRGRAQHRSARGRGRVRGPGRGLAVQPFPVAGFAVGARIALDQVGILAVGHPRLARDRRSVLEEIVRPRPAAQPFVPVLVFLRDVPFVHLVQQAFVGGVLVQHQQVGAQVVPGKMEEPQRLVAVHPQPALRVAAELAVVQVPGRHVVAGVPQHQQVLEEARGQVDPALVREQALGAVVVAPVQAARRPPVQEGRAFAHGRQRQESQVEDAMPQAAQHFPVQEILGVLRGDGDVGREHHGVRRQGGLDFFQARIGHRVGVHVDHAPRVVALEDLLECPGLDRGAELDDRVLEDPGFQGFDGQVQVRDGQDFVEGGIVDVLAPRIGQHTGHVRFFPVHPPQRLRQRDGFRDVGVVDRCEEIFHGCPCGLSV